MPGLWSTLLWQKARYAPVVATSANLTDSLARIWEQSATLSGLVPFEKVYTGRVPPTNYQNFPWVSIIVAAASKTLRSSRCSYSRLPVSFHIWVDDAHLAEGQQIDAAISAVYSDSCWRYTPLWKVIDVLDQGPGRQRQVNWASYQAWEIIHIMTLHLQRTRTDDPTLCCAGAGMTGSMSGSSRHASGGSS